MRWLIPVLLAGCTEQVQWGDVVTVEGNTMLPITDTETYTVTQDGCTDDCGPYIPYNWTVTIETGASFVAVTNIRKSTADGAIAAFDLTGSTEGSASLLITAEAGARTTFTLTVVN